MAGGAGGEGGCGRAGCHAGAGGEWSRRPEVRAVRKEVGEVGGCGEGVGVTWTPGHPRSLRVQDERGDNVGTAKLTSEWTVERVETYLNERGFYRPGQERETARVEL